MAYSIVVAGGTLYRLSALGVATPLTLPVGITLSSTRPPRFAVLGRSVYVTNNPLRSLCVDADFHVRPMQLTPPSSAPTVAAGAAGGLTGAYKVKYTYVVIHPDTHALLAESDFSPESAPITLAAQKLSASTLEISPDAATTHHRMYRTLANGEEFFSWIDVAADAAAVADDLSDVLLPNLTAPRELGVGPGLLPATYMTLCAEWKNRLWAVGDRDIDTLRYSGEGIAYGWPSTYGLDIKPIGADEFGITGLMARKDLLGVGKRQSFWKISGGNTDADGVPQFDVQRERDGKGCHGPSIVIDDTAFYLGADGVYAWGPNGFECPSDGKVRKWFATDGYFNRGLYPDAFMKYNERYNTLELHLAAAGSETIDRWVALDLATGAWYGPHFTNKAGPTSGFTLVDAESKTIAAIGADDGVIYAENQPGFSDAGETIPIDLISKWHDANTPPITKVFGGVTLISRAQPAVGHCLVRYRAGVIGADVSQVVPADMRVGTQTLPRVGVGQVVQVQITEDTNGAGCEVFGYEIPFYELANRGRR